MHRIRVALAIVFVVLLFAAPALPPVGDMPTLAAHTAEAEDITEMDPDGPEVPPLIGATGLAVAAVVIGYGVRVRARYRVVE